MRIEELHIKNFRGIEYLTMEFPPSNSVVLIGINPYCMWIINASEQVCCILSNPHFFLSFLLCKVGSITFPNANAKPVLVIIVEPTILRPKEKLRPN